MKKLIRQWLCEHSKTYFVKKIVITEEYKNESWILDLKQWDRCKLCDKLIYSHIKFNKKRK